GGIRFGRGLRFRLRGRVCCSNRGRTSKRQGSRNGSHSNQRLHVSFPPRYTFCLSMISSENRYPLFRIMLQEKAGPPDGEPAHSTRAAPISPAAPVAMMVPVVPAVPPVMTPVHFGRTRNLLRAFLHRSSG